VNSTSKMFAFLFVIRTVHLTAGEASLENVNRGLGLIRKN
jgi:hypothetical protein